MVRATGDVRACATSGLEEQTIVPVNGQDAGGSLDAGGGGKR